MSTYIIVADRMSRRQYLKNRLFSISAALLTRVFESIFLSSRTTDICWTILVSMLFINSSRLQGTYLRTVSLLLSPLLLIELDRSSLYLQE